MEFHVFWHVKDRGLSFLAVILVLLTSGGVKRESGEEKLIVLYEETGKFYKAKRNYYYGLNAWCFIL